MARSRRRVQVTDRLDVVHSYDPDAAADALRRVLQFDPGALDGKGWAAQLQGVRALYDDLGAFYVAANVPPQSDPVYVDTWSAWHEPNYQPTNGAACVIPVDPADGAWRRLNGIGPSLSPWGFAGERRRSVIARRLTAAFQRFGRIAVGTDHILIRVELDERARRFEVCAAGRDGEGVCGFGEGTLYIGCAQDGATSEGCRPYDWLSLAWSDDPWPTGYRKVLPPLRWFADFAVEVGAAIAARTDPFGLDPVAATVAASARYVSIQNAATMAAYDLADGEALRTAASNVRADIQAAGEQAAIDTSNDMLRAGALWAAAATAMAGPFGAAAGAIAGAIVAVGAAIARILPYAVGVEVDRFGRSLPMLLVATIPDAPAADGERTIVEHSTWAPPDTTERAAPGGAAFASDERLASLTRRLQGGTVYSLDDQRPTLTILPNTPPPPEGESSGGVMLPILAVAALAAAAASSKR